MPWSPVSSLAPIAILYSTARVILQKHKLGYKNTNFPCEIPIKASRHHTRITIRIPNPGCEELQTLAVSCSPGWHLSSQGSTCPSLSGDVHTACAQSLSLTVPSAWVTLFLVPNHVIKFTLKVALSECLFWLLQIATSHSESCHLVLILYIASTSTSNFLLCFCQYFPH